MKSEKILLIDVCREAFHYFEFVKPIEDILKVGDFDYSTKHYTELKKGDIERFSRVIICGTSLADNDFLIKKNLLRFKWLFNFTKPVLGICAGMQILGLILQKKVELGLKKEIGFYYENFSKSFLGLEGKQEVYHLHNNSVVFNEGWEEFTNSKVNQAVKHCSREIYGVLFHPEVRQKGLITNFCNL